jgi:hypothetical protein
MTTVRITCSDHWTYNRSPQTRSPLTALDRNGGVGHIHARLTIELAGRSIPQLGYGGPDDVCLNTWIIELCNIVNELAKPGAEYVFDEGEQGQPAFGFTRVGDEVAFALSYEGKPVKKWKNVKCLYADLRAEVARFLDGLRAELRRQAPTTWKDWWPARAVLSPREIDRGD